MTLTHCRGVLTETRREAELLEANGINVHAVRRYLERLEAAVVADEAGGRYLTTSAHAKRRGVSAETVRQYPLDTTNENRRGTLGLGGWRTWRHKVGGSTPTPHPATKRRG